MKLREFVLAIAAGAIGLLLAIAPVRAHHSVAAGFDMEKTTTVVGTIAKMEWRNPHAGSRST